ncbi:hypothetical protein TRFO_32745 [Tritrichomonas foetus]|uniref:Uncharacterized protein n=1 Tax=Tritrichomonas foetus TaxID=1144522 RepID=A0A1J4JN60_9EUKA|nr:hypothetical protein TRFO_32745 [Tritrichomonas foetus]|eukprot:OHT00515.1 hypothetical protein TRFO_32745 [Tritrichomonas foetus]
MTPNKPEDIKLPIFDNVVNKTVEFSVNKSEIIQGNHYSVSVANNLTIQFQDEGSNNLYFKVNYESAVITFTSTNDDKRPINTGIIPTTNGVTTVNIENDNFNLNIRGDGFVNIATSNQNLTAFNISNVLLEQNESLVIKSKNENVPIYLSNLELYNSPYFKANSSDLHIYNIIVQQGSTPTVEDCIVLKEIITGLNTSLNLGQNVNLSSAVSCILYNTGIVSERAAFTGNLSNPPSKIIFRLTQINTVLADGETTDDTEYKMIIAENPRDCKAWRNIVDMTGSIYQTAKCEKNQQGITQLVVSSKKQNKNKLGAGPIAGIAIACVVVVAVIVGVTVYISRKSNLSLGIESTIYESEDSIAI